MTKTKKELVYDIVDIESQNINGYEWSLNISRAMIGVGDKCFDAGSVGTAQKNSKDVNQFLDDLAIVLEGIIPKDRQKELTQLCLKFRNSFLLEGKEETKE